MTAEEIRKEFGVFRLLECAYKPLSEAEQHGRCMLSAAICLAGEKVFEEAETDVPTLHSHLKRCGYYLEKINDDLLTRETVKGRKFSHAALREVKEKSETLMSEAKAYADGAPEEERESSLWGLIFVTGYLLACDTVEGCRLWTASTPEREWIWSGLLDSMAHVCDVLDKELVGNGATLYDAALGAFQKMAA